MRIVHHPRFLAAIGLFGLACLIGLPINGGNSGFISVALGQSKALTKSQSEALSAYNKSVQDFRSILSERDSYTLLMASINFSATGFTAMDLPMSDDDLDTALSSW